MATLAANLVGLNAGTRYQRSGWPANRWVSLKIPGEIETLTLADLQGTWGIPPVTKNLNIVWWLTPSDFSAEDYSAES